MFLDEPFQLVDVSRLKMKQIEPTNEGGLKIGALVTNTELANHLEVRRNHPLLSRAILGFGLQSVGLIESLRKVEGETTTSKRYYRGQF